MQILILGGLREDSLTDLEKECDVTVGPAGHRLHDDREWVLDHIAVYACHIHSFFFTDYGFSLVACVVKCLANIAVNRLVRVCRIA